MRPEDAPLIERTIASIMAAIPPSSGLDLVGFEMDACLYFIQARVFSDVGVKRTDDPSCLIRARLTIGDEVSAIQDIWKGLRVAAQSLGYRNFGAFSIISYREAVSLRFVTVIRDDLFHVTGTAFAHGPSYPELVAKHDRDSGELTGLLPPLPGGLPSWAIL